jgi:hypothetical protein
MKRISPLLIFFFTLSVLACGLFGSAPTYSEPTKPIAPITIGSDLTSINLCDAIPQEDIEAVMGRKLSKTPEHFEYYETGGSSGCIYEAEKDADGGAHFGYVVLTPLSEYDNQPLYLNVDVVGIGDEAYFNNGADARQLWVKIKDKVAFVVAFGDVENEEGAKAIATLLVTAIQ